MPRTAGPTLASIAAAVGVTKSTVSKALNDRPGVSDEVRRRVRAAVAEAGYEPAPRARVGGRTVAVIFDTLANLYSLRLLDALVAEAQGRDVEIVPDVLLPLLDGPGGIPTEERIRALHARGHSGLLVVTTRMPASLVRLCAELDLPLVAIDPPNALDSSVASVGSNSWMGGMHATQHLIELGHRRIGFVGGSPQHTGLRERRAGYRTALEQAGIEEDPALVSELGMLTAGQPAADMLELPDPPTAFFAGTDASALDVLRHLRAAGVDVPGDVSVVGYDDAYAVLPLPVAITTVHTPIAEIGRVALGTVLGLRDGIPPISHHLELATELVVRETTAPRR
ncbi:substrate-binding domain-containing protein [Microbacterium indicum]|uniref:substrate-binding domain-containing protein n=1 Tax=Microbacterium indicum TaxID=358100 RepID=UPI0004061FBE|nr:substrate-binding domain-containing protein [Microbacterium indicum]